MRTGRGLQGLSNRLTSLGGFLVSFFLVYAFIFRGTCRLLCCTLLCRLKFLLILLGKYYSVLAFASRHVANNIDQPIINSIISVCSLPNVVINFSFTIV